MPIKLTILDAHIKYFQENGYITFEELLPQNTLQKLVNETESIISSCEKDPCRRDLFRNSAFIKKIAFNNAISSILKNLTKKQNFRLVFDQLIIKKDITSFSLDSDTSFQNLIGGIMINIPPKDLNLNDLNKIMFVKNSFFINLEKLDFDVFLLIGYGEIKTIYKKNMKDPYNTTLKNLGYNYGDLLKDAFHPVVC